MSYTVFSWYTPAYAEYAERLRYSLKLLHLPHVLRQVESLGDWDSNVRRMGEMVLWALNETQGDVLYVDADCEFRYRPAMFDYWPGHDIGIHKLYNDHYANGTVYYSNSGRVQGMLAEMDKALKGGSAELDQRLLMRLVPKHRLTVCPLPPEYVCIQDTMRYKFPGICPIILHRQASRVQRHAYG